jgi:hypothetical protein
MQAEQNQLIKELVSEVCQRDGETLKVLQKIADNSNTSLSAVTQTLAGRPVPMPVGDGYGNTPPRMRSPEEAPPPALSATEKARIISPPSPAWT